VHPRSEAAVHPRSKTLEYNSKARIDPIYERELLLGIEEQGGREAFSFAQFLKNGLVPEDLVEKVRTRWKTLQRHSEKKYLGILKDKNIDGHWVNQASNDLKEQQLHRPTDRKQRKSRGKAARNEEQGRQGRVLIVEESAARNEEQGRQGRVLIAEESPISSKVQEHNRVMVTRTPPRSTSRTSSRSPPRSLVPASPNRPQLGSPVVSKAQMKYLAGKLLPGTSFHLFLLL